MRKTVCAGLLVLMVGLLLKWAIAPGANQALELNAGSIGATLLPYQAIRVRITVANRGMMPITDYPLVENRCYITEKKVPGSSEFEPIDKSPREWAPLRYHSPGTGGYYSRAAYDSTITLMPGERQSISTALIGLFIGEGEYSLKFFCFHSVSKRQDLHAPPLKVTVGKATGVDAEVLKLICQDEKIANEFLFTVSVRQQGDAKLTPVLEKIVRDYPRSSYADYARFGLGMAYSNGKVDIFPGFQTWRITPEESKAIKAQLEAIDYKTFPYAPDALVLLRSLYRDNPKEIQKIDKILQDNYWDAIEWLEAQYHDKVPFEQILENRKAPGGKAKRE